MNDQYSEDELKQLIDDVNITVLGELTTRDLEIRYGWAETLLHYAAYEGKLSVVKLLCEKGLSNYAFCDSGNYAIHYAASMNHSDVIDYLISVDPGIVNLTNDNRETPLHIAASQNAVLAMISLINNGANIRNTTLQSVTAFDILFDAYPGYLNLFDVNATNFKDITMMLDILQKIVNSIEYKAYWDVIESV